MCRCWLLLAASSHVTSAEGAGPHTSPARRGLAHQRRVGTQRLFSATLTECCCGYISSFSYVLGSKLPLFPYKEELYMYIHYKDSS